MVVVVPGVSEPEPLGRNGTCRAEARSAKAGEGGRSGSLLGRPQLFDDRLERLDDFVALDPGLRELQLQLKAFVGAL